MAYSSTVIEVMIASPSDVTRERLVAREVIQQWNAINSKRAHAVFLPVMWETHASPVMGDRAQEIIDKEVLEECDLLIGIFWTRIGTPTGDSVSGTVEEIQKHIGAGKPAMLYFSLSPVIPDSVDAEQFRQLKEFREYCKQNGLIETFTDPNDFEKKLLAHLSLRLDKDKYLQSVLENTATPGDDGTVFEITTPETPGIPSLSEEAQQLLMEASEDRFGIIMLTRFVGGMLISTNGKQFGAEHDRRSQAAWESGVLELRDNGLVRDRGYEGKAYELTHQGYQVADLLKARRHD